MAFLDVLGAQAKPPWLNVARPDDRMIVTYSTITSDII